MADRRSEPGRRARSPDAAATTGLERWARAHAVPLVGTCVALVLGTNYSLWWPRAAHGQPAWGVPTDIWYTYASTDALVHLHLSQIYTAQSALVTFPAVLVVLAPFVAVCQALGLTIAGPTAPIVTYPTAWLVLEPVVILLGCSVLFAGDDIAGRLGVAPARRVVLCAVEIAALQSLVMVWGHPEDAVAVALALYALVAACDGRWRRCGWLVGAALAFQPVTVLVVPVLFGLAARRLWPALAARAVVPSLALLAGPAIAAWHATTYAIVDQPNYPAADHPTPFIGLAPTLSHQAVAAGPARLLAVAVSAVMGYAVARRSPGLPVLLLVVGAAFALRTVFESVSDAFYTWPVLAVALLVASLAGRVRFAAAGALSLFVDVSSNWRWHGEWTWWAMTSVSLVAMLAMAAPRRRPGAVATTGSKAVLAAAP